MGRRFNSNRSLSLSILLTVERFGHKLRPNIGQNSCGVIENTVHPDEDHRDKDTDKERKSGVYTAIIQFA